MRSLAMAGGVRKLGIAATLGAVLATLAGAQTPAFIDEDLVHEFVQRGKVLPGNGSVKPENQLQAKGTVAAYVTEDSLHLMTLHESCLLIMCAPPCEGRPSASVSVPLASRSDGRYPVLGLLRATRTGWSDFQATVAVLTVDGLLRKEVVTVANGVLKDRKLTTPIRPSGGVSSRIRAIADLAGIATDPGFLLLGTQGLMIRVDEKGDALPETRLNAGVEEDFLAQGDGYVGTFTGAIYRLKNAYAPPYLEFLARSNPGGQAVKRITSRVAILAGGYFMVNRGDFWVTSPRPSLSPAGVHPMPSVTGTVARVFLSTGTEDVVIGDLPTRLLYHSRDGAYLPPPSLPLRYEGGAPQTWRVAFRDPDRNARPPRISFDSERPMRDVFQPAVQADPAHGCLETGKCISGAETILEVTLRQDSVFLSMPILEGIRKVDSVCRRPYFTGRPGRFEASFPWRRGETLQIGHGGQALGLTNGAPAGVAAGNPARTGARSRFLEGWRFRATTPAGRAYGLDGRDVTFRLP